MHASDKGVLIVMLILVGLGIVLAIGLVLSPTSNIDEKYRQGQIDALTGQVKYELRVNPDSTQTWYEIEK